MSQNINHSTVAQRNQVPPELRQWAYLKGINVEKIERFHPKNEKVGRGWKIYVESIGLKSLPDGYRLGRAAIDSGYIQVREE